MIGVYWTKRRNNREEREREREREEEGEQKSTIAGIGFWRLLAASRCIEVRKGP